MGWDVNALSYFAAFAGGLVSFLSPCVMPIVPAYLSLITGLDSSELEDGRRQHLVRITRDTGLFVLGFGSVFVLLGMAATSMGQFVARNQALLTRSSGVLIVAMSAFMIGSLMLQAPWLYQEMRFHPNLGRLGRAAPPVAGVAFGLGWTPCIGPVLTSILLVAANADTVWSGAGLLGAYSLGLGVPFLATGLLFGQMTSAMSAMKRHMPRIVLVSSMVLALFGVLLMFNQLSWLTTQISRLLNSLGLDWIVELG
jgi:cytochrome c-type biogenesis protein